MTKDEAIYLLRNTAWLAPSDTLESVEEAVDMATEALKAGTEMSLPKWIPCSERLLEDGRYLCDYGDCIDFGRVTHGKWYVDGAIAWMPLPEPWKGENDD